MSVERVVFFSHFDLMLSIKRAGDALGGLHTVHRYSATLLGWARQFKKQKVVAPLDKS